MLVRHGINFFHSDLYQPTDGERCCSGNSVGSLYCVIILKRKMSFGEGLLFDKTASKFSLHFDANVWVCVCVRVWLLVFTSLSFAEHSGIESGKCWSRSLTPMELLDHVRSLFAVTRMTMNTRQRYYNEIVLIEVVINWFSATLSRRLTRMTSVKTNRKLSGCIATSKLMLVIILPSDWQLTACRRSQ